MENAREIEVTTAYRKRGRPFGTKRQEPGHSRSVHVPERVQTWLEERTMKLTELVSDAPNWYVRMNQQAEDLRLADMREKELEEERNALRRRNQKLVEENADLLRTKTKFMAKLGGVSA